MDIAIQSFVSHRNDLLCPLTPALSTGQGTNAEQPSKGIVETRC
jgi:hypothetical protein